MMEVSRVTMLKIIIEEDNKKISSEQYGAESTLSFRPRAGGTGKKVRK